MIVSLIVALDEANGIGWQGGLPWRLPADLRRFKRLTMGHHLICGRKTYQSIGRPLPGRTMIVVTRQKDFQAPGCRVVHSLDAALALAEAAGEEEAFVIGGAALYAAALPYAGRMYLTRVHAVLPADVHFPEFDEGQWSIVEQEALPADRDNPHPTSFFKLVRNPFRRSLPALLVFLVLLVLSFGLMIPWLGFYWDDWPIVLATRLQGVGVFWDYYRLERPFSAWSYIVTIPFLGTQPLTWHIFTLLLRWLTVVGMWWCLKLLWPRRAQQNIWAVLLFAVYPVFTNQPVALTFSQQWVCFSLYFLSVGWMLQAARASQKRWLLHTGALIAMALHMLTMEYIWGLELLRPVLLWLFLTDRVPGWNARLKRVFNQWLPYLLVFVAIVGWRIVFANELVQGNEPMLLFELLSRPLATSLQLVQVALQDMINNLVGAWYQTINPVDLDLADLTVLASLALGVVTAGLTFWYLKCLDGGSPAAERSTLSQDDKSDGWVGQALLVGLLGALLGPLPVWLIERQALVGLHSGRFALAGMFGLSILIVALLEWFTPRRIQKMALLAVLVGLAAGFHLRNAVTYYRSTLRQNDFYRQLYWRAPYILPNTAILSADELFPYVGRNPTAVTLNLLYPQPYGIRQVGYWFLELFHDIGPAVVPRLGRGRTFTPEFRTFSFRGSSLDSLVIYYKPGAGRCLWVLSPEDVDNPELPEITRQALPVSNLSRIQAQPAAGEYPPTDLFGREPAHGWCYYYQKAELARQQGDWQAIVQLGEQAEHGGYRAGNGNERLVFIEAEARTGDWQAALQHSAEVFAADNDLASRVCRLWERIAADAQIPPPQLPSLEKLRNELSCQPAP